MKKRCYTDEHKDLLRYRMIYYNRAISLKEDMALWTEEIPHYKKML
jgi:hypothetical protein